MFPQCRVMYNDFCFDLVCFDFKHTLTDSTKMYTLILVSRLMYVLFDTVIQFH